MRRLLVDHTRAKRAAKRNLNLLDLSSPGVTHPISGKDQELLILDDSLTRLEKFHPRAAKVVELRYFGGLTEKEAAEVLDISVPTLKRDWMLAKTWLFSQIYGDE